jgi:hypothetical protein
MSSTEEFFVVVVVSCGIERISFTWEVLSPIFRKKGED